MEIASEVMDHTRPHPFVACVYIEGKKRWVDVVTMLTQSLEFEVLRRLDAASHENAIRKRRELALSRVSFDAWGLMKKVLHQAEYLMHSS